MSVKETKNEKGRLSWLITVLELVIIIAYFVIGFGGIADAFENMDFAGMFESVRVAILFLIIATAGITVMCFLPLFKSKGNIRWAIWNIIWIAFSIYSIL